MKVKQLIRLFKQGYLFPKPDRWGELHAKCALATCAQTNCPAYRHIPYCSYTKPDGVTISRTYLPALQPFLNDHPEFLI